MFDFLNKNKKSVCLILIAAVFLSAVVLPMTALAQDTGGAARARDTTAAAATSASTGGLIGWFAAKTILLASSVVSAIIGAFFGILLSIEAKIIDYLLSPEYFSFTNAAIVRIGWTITRDLANMFFIVILLIASFAIVLRRQSYSINSLLPKLVIAALLINFSLVFAGIIIDASQAATVFFIKQGIGTDTGTITEKLATSMNIINFYNPAQPDSTFKGIAEFGRSSIAAIVGLILTVVGLVMTVFIFGATAVMLVLRIIHIWFLLIFLPLAIAGSVFPQTSGQLSTWWKKFSDWVFFAPAYAFMIYLSLKIFDESGKIGRATFAGATPAGWNESIPGLTTIMPSAIFQWIVVLSIMFYSLTVAKKFGVAFGGTAEKVLTGWKNSTKNWAGRQVRRGAVAAVQPLPPGAPTPTGVRGLIRRGGAALGGAALATPGLRGQYLKLQAEQNTAYQADYGKYKGLNKPTLEAISAGLIIDPRERLALQQAQIEQDIYKPKADEASSLLDKARGYGQEEKFLDLISGKDFFSTDYGYDMPQINGMLDRAKRYGKDEKILGVVADKLIGKDKGQIKPNYDELKGLLDRAEQYPNQTRKMFNAVIEKLGAKGLKNYSAPDLAALIQRAEKQDKADDLLKIFPQFSSSVNKSVSEVVGKIKAADASKISDTALSDPEVMKAITTKFIGEHVMNLAKEGRADVIDALENGIKEMGGIKELEKNENNPRLAKWMKKSPGSTFFKGKYEETQEKTEKEEKTASPKITIAGEYTPVPPQSERKG